MVIGVLVVLVATSAEVSWPAVAMFGAGALATLAVTAIVVVLGWLAAEIWTFSRLRIPVFDPPQDDAR